MAEGKAPAQKRGWLFWVFVGTGGLLALGALAQLADPEGTARREAERAAAAQQEEAAAQAQSAQGLATWRAAFDALALPCEAGIAATGEMLALANGADFDPVSAYRAAQLTENKCGEAHLNLDDLPEPADLSGDQEDQLEEAVTQCKTAFYTRKRVATAAMVIFDGDRSPSAQADLALEVEGAAEVSAVCARLVNAVAPNTPSEAGAAKAPA